MKRKVPLKGLTYGVIIPAASSSVKQEVTLQSGIPSEKAKDVVKASEGQQAQSAGGHQWGP